MLTVGIPKDNEDALRILWIKYQDILNSLFPGTEIHINRLFSIYIWILARSVGTFVQWGDFVKSTNRQKLSL